jgi:hypothetical protein
VRNIEKECLPHPRASLLRLLGVARRAKSPGAVRKHQEAFLPTVVTADAGEPVARVAAFQIALDEFRNNGLKESILLLEEAFILSQESVKMMEENAVEDGALRMPGTINSWHHG